MTKLLSLLPLALLLPAPLAAQGDGGPYARVAVIRPAAGRAQDFEAGYRRHLDWHRAAGDPWAWYGWSVSFGDRLGWFVDATFGHSAAELDQGVAPAEDGADNARNVTPNGEFVANLVYRFLPSLSNGGPAPGAAPFLEWTTVEVVPGREAEFERLAAASGQPPAGTRWYRLVAGAGTPAYLRLRPMAGLRDLGDGRTGLSAAAGALVRSVMVQLLRYRPELSLGVEG